MAQCGTVSRVWRHTAVHIAAATRGGGTEKPGCRAAAIAHPASTARVDNTVQGPVKELLLLHICTTSTFAGGEPHCVFGEAARSAVKNS
eukprot:COSAG02_NODE_14422_length_1274_cov_1.597447_1_plen_89_part_00